MNYECCASHSEIINQQSEIIFLLYVLANGQQGFLDYDLRAPRKPIQNSKIRIQKSEDYFWWLWSGCSPLPIPNREVKPRIADDTALVCGKVGRRQFFIRESISVPFFCLSNPIFPVSLQIENGAAYMLASSYRPRNSGHDYYGRGTYLITLVVASHAHLLAHFTTEFGRETIAHTTLGEAVHQLTRVRF